MPKFREYLEARKGQIITLKTGQKILAEDVLHTLVTGGSLTIDHNSARVTDYQKHSKLTREALDADVISEGGNLYLRLSSGSTLERLGFKLSQPDSVDR